MTNPPPITGGFAHADPNAAPLTLNELIDILNSLLAMKIDGSYIPYVIQHGTPGADQTDLAWIELDTAGRPLSLRTYYNGHWRRLYSGLIGEIRMYSGDPSDEDIWTTTGHGVVGGEYDGWQICNGKNGSPDLSDQFIVGAHMNDKDHAKYDGGWQTFVDGKTMLKTGGSKDHMIAMNELPPFDPGGGPNGKGLSDVVLHGHANKDDSPEHGSTSPIVDTQYANLKPEDFLIGHYGSSPDANPADPQMPVPTVPPFYCLAYIIFQGYTT